MYFSGHQKTSFIDYPDKISTVVFAAKCNFRCPFCHNSELVYGNGIRISEEYIFDYLQKRRTMIDSVCISGGECTLYDDIDIFIRKVKKLGYLVKIDTNGTNPKLLAKLIDEKLLDYIAMDIKAPIHKYDLLTGVKTNTEKILESIQKIQNGKIDYEFRTTLCKELLNEEDILAIGRLLKGSKTYALQNFKDGDTILAGKNKFTPYGKEELMHMKESIKDCFEVVKIRF
ncbi:anaerobic ribonucleoside-triphosphate reductase activating protein [Clostridiaceae bacterium 35-E11]